MWVCVSVCVSTCEYECPCTNSRVTYVFSCGCVHVYMCVSTSRTCMHVRVYVHVNTRAGSQRKTRIVFPVGSEGVRESSG